MEMTEVCPGELILFCAPVMLTDVEKQSLYSLNPVKVTGGMLNENILSIIL
jgi:hypothetical protein